MTPERLGLWLGRAAWTLLIAGLLLIALVFLSRAEAGGWRGGAGGTWSGPWHGTRGVWTGYVFSPQPRPPGDRFYYNPDDVAHSCRMGWLDELPTAEQPKWIDGKRYSMPGWRCPVENLTGPAP